MAIAYTKRAEFLKIMLREEIKQKIDNLSEDQLKQVERFITTIQAQSEQFQKKPPLWQTATKEERIKDLEEWASQFPKTGGSLPDEAYDRENIY